MRDFDLYRWLDRFRRDGLTTSLRLELRDCLTPRVSLREPFRWTAQEEDTDNSERLKDLVDWEIVLSTEHVHSVFRDHRPSSEWAATLPRLLDDFSGLLRDALDLMRELGGADDRSDLSYLHQPSIGEHPQNKDFRDWTILVELTRDAWLAQVDANPVQARLAAESWWLTPYPLFKRLAFFAAAHGSTIDQQVALDWLLADEGWWLWSIESEREAMRLLVALASRLQPCELAKLEAAILEGPPRKMFMDDIEPQRWTEVSERETWLRLAKISATGTTLGAAAQAVLADLSARYPEWKVASDERDEFPTWMESGWVGDRDPWRTFVSIPRSRRGVLDYLMDRPVLESTKQDDWKERCRDSLQATSYALHALSRRNLWPEARWRDALQAWSEEQLINRAWRYVAPVLVNAPDEVFLSVGQGISWWLQSVAKSFEGNDSVFLTLCRRVLSVDHEGGVDTDEPVLRAINHPVGHVTEALLRWWYRRPLEDGQALPEDLAPIFTDLCDDRIAQFRHARVLLAAHSIALFRVDEEWARRFLLPLFDWNRSEAEARSAWEGFLWSPRLYRPLFDAIKAYFLDTARHYSALGKHDEQYASLLTFAALDPGETFSRSDLAIATRALPIDGLRHTAHALVRALEGASEQRDAYWTNRVVPYLQSIWPKSRDNITPGISEALARLCIAAQAAFPQALSALRAWLQPIQHPHVLLHRMLGAGLCAQFPEPALAFIDIVVGDDSQWPSADLTKCLQAITGAESQLIEDDRLKRLSAYLRRHGQA